MVRFLLLGLFACLFSSASADCASRKVFTATAPVRSILQKLAGNHVQVVSLVAPGREPDSFDPSPKELRSLASAQIYFSLGLPFEQSIQIRIKEISQNLQLVDLRKNITDRLRINHSHGGKAHEIEDPHFWTSPIHMLRMTEIAHAKLVESYPEFKSDFDRNLLAIASEVNALDRFIREALAPFKGREIWVFHAAWGYYAQQYNLVQVAVEAPNKERSPKQVADLVRRARQSKIKTIFSQPQLSKSQPDFFAKQIGAKLVLVDPLREDYFVNLRAVTESFIKSLSP